MSILKRRIGNQGAPGPDLRVVGRYNTPEEMPSVRVGIYPGVITYQDLTAIITPNGAPIAATGQGSYGQLYSAGRLG